MANNNTYVSYEEDIKGVYTYSQMRELYKEEVNKEEYTTFEDWLFDMLKSGVFEEMTEKENLTILSGTFAIGCGIMARDEKWNMYHLLVVADRETNKPCIELHNEVYFEEDLNK